MFRPGAPSYSIDLNLPESQRWREVIAQDRPIAQAIVEQAGAELERVPRVLRWTFAQLYKRFGGLYQGEIQAWAKAMSISVGTATMLNCLYELSHVHVPKIFGCTAGVRWVAGLGMVHVRTLDWPLDCMGDATRLFWFTRGERKFVSVGVPAQLGVLSGMVPGGYSVTINWAPPGRLPNFDFGPTFLLRHTLETCDTFEQAQGKLRDTPLSTSVFFTMCGTKPGEACVIERTQNAAVVRPLDNGCVVQANHHVAPDFADANEFIREVPPEEEVFSIAGSTKRYDLLRSTLNASTGSTPDELVKTLDEPTVFNDQTCQKMVFCPRTGQVQVWRRISSAGEPS